MVTIRNFPATVRNNYTGRQEKEDLPQHPSVFSKTLKSHAITCCRLFVSNLDAPPDSAAGGPGAEPST